MNDIFIVLSNLDDNPYIASSIKGDSDYDLEGYLGFFDDFSSRLLIRSDFINVLPKDSIKLILNITNLPGKFELNIDKTLIEKIQCDPSCFLWIFSPHEATIDLHSLLVFLKTQKIPAEKIIFTNSDTEIDKSTQNGLKCVTFPEWWEARYRYLVKTNNNFSFTSPQFKKKQLESCDRNFLCLNRNLKIHRVWTYYTICQLPYINGYVSYNLPKIAKKENTDFRLWVKNQLNMYDLNHPKLLKSKKIYKTKELDTIDKNYNINLQNDIKQYYDKSFVSIITESLENKPFITEKTFKTMCHSHAFVTVGGGPQGQILKKRGYKTFENLFGIDHVNNQSQLKKVLERINGMSIDNMRKTIQTQFFPLIEHNYNHFFTRTISLNRFLKKISDYIYETR